jgi:zinc protease
MAASRQLPRPPERATPPGPGALWPFEFPRVERRALSNGVRVAIAEVHDFPVVTVSVMLEAGGTREPAQLAGNAALTAALLDSGAGNRSAAQIAELVESLGVQLDNGAGWETAHVGITALRSRLEPALDVLVDLIREPTFPQEEVERLRAERLAEILQRRADPRALATEGAARFIYSPATPFARPLGGSAATIQRLTRQDVVAFHARYFTPGGTSIVVAGDVSPATALELLEPRFAGWAGGLEPARPLETRPRQTTPQVVVVDRPGAVQSEIRVGHFGVARSTPDYFPLLVMNAILGGTFSSRLNLNLREKHGFTYGASSGFSMRRQPGSFLVSTAVQTEVTVAAVSEILRELHAIRDAPVTPEELGDARNYLAGVFPLRLQTTDGIASRLAELLIYDLPDDYFDHYRDNVLAVEADEVNRVARRHVRPDEAAVVVVGDAASVRAGLEQLDFAPPLVITPETLDQEEVGP